MMKTTWLQNRRWAWRQSIVGLVILWHSFALTQTGVGISPPRVELPVLPGGEVTQTVRVDNPSQVAALSVEAYFSDILLAPDGSSIYLEGGSIEKSIAPWVTVNPLNFILDPSDVLPVSYTVSVPDDAAPGTYWSVLFFESQSPDTRSSESGIGVTTVVRVGHIIYATVGQPTLEGRIVGIRYDNSRSAGAIRLTIQNSGDGLIRMDGHIEVRSLTGNLVQTLSMQGAASFPDSTHDLVVPMSEPLASGEYVILAVLDYGAASVIAGEGQVQVP